MEKLEKLDVLMIIFAIIVCLFALLVMHGWPKWDWSAFSAISTFLAVAVALTFGAKESIERKRLRKKKSDLAASSLLSTVIMVKVNLIWCCEDLEDPRSLTKSASHVLSMITAYLNSYKLVSAEHIESIYEEDQEMAMALAGGLSDLQSRAYSLNINFTNDPNELWGDYVQRLRGPVNFFTIGLYQTIQNLDRATRNLEKIRDASIRANKPSPPLSLA